MNHKNFEENNLLIDLGDNKESQEVKDNIWVDEKDKREESVIKFINNFDYDGYFFSEFATTGDITIMTKVKEGSLRTSSIECYYEKNKITKIKVRFDNDLGKFLEVNLSGNVVKDYLFLNNEKA